MLVQPDTRSLPPTGAAYVADEGELAMSSAAAAAAERAENAGFWGLEKTPFIKLVRRRVKRTVARPTHKASQEPTPELRAAVPASGTADEDDDYKIKMESMISASIPEMANPAEPSLAKDSNKRQQRSAPNRARRIKAPPQAATKPAKPSFVSPVALLPPAPLEASRLPPLVVVPVRSDDKGASMEIAESYGIIA